MHPDELLKLLLIKEIRQSPQVVFLRFNFAFTFMCAFVWEFVHISVGSSLSPGSRISGSHEPSGMGA